MARKHNKIPHVSLFKDRNKRWRLEYTLNRKRVTERLGAYESNARQRALEVSQLIDKLKSKLIQPNELSKLVKNRVPLKKHLADYEQELKASRNSPRYIQCTVGRLNKLFEILGAKRLDHMNVSTLSKVSISLAQLPGRNNQLMSAETINQYLRAASQFLEWCRSHGSIIENPMKSVKRLPGGSDPRHTRRIPSAAEMETLLAWLGTAKRHSDGATSPADRAMYYRMLYATGLRAGELRACKVDWIKFEEPVRIEVPSTITKNGKDAVQPIPSWLVSQLKEWLPGHGDMLFPRFSDIKHTFSRDQERAREWWIEQASTPAEKANRAKTDFLVRRTGEGVWDLHSFRHLYVTSLVQSGANVKDAVTLARHASADLTVGTYTHASKQMSQIVETAIKPV